MKDNEINDYLDSCTPKDIQSLIKELAQHNYLIGYNILGKFNVDTLYDDLEEDQIHDFIKILREEKWLFDLIQNINICVAEEQFEECLKKLHGNWNRLTTEEEVILTKIASRF